MFFYIKNLNSGHFGHRHTSLVLIPETSMRVVFEGDKAVFQRQDGNIETERR